MTERILGRVSARLGENKDSDDNSNDTSKGPKDCSSLKRSVSIKTNRSMGQSTYIKPREPLVAQGGNSIAKQGDAEEDEKDLVGLARKDTNFFAGFVDLGKDVDTSDKEQGCSKIDGKCNGNVANDIQPSTDPTSGASPLRRSKHKGLVIHT